MSRRALGPLTLFLSLLAVLLPGLAHAGSSWGELSLAAGGVAQVPSVGLAGELGARTGPLRGSLELGGWVRARPDLGGPPMPGATTSAEVALELWVGHRAVLGPMAALDLAWLSWRENPCAMGDGCRFWRAEELGDVLVAWEPAAGLSWNTNAREPTARGLELSVLLAVPGRWDYAYPFPRTELTWRTGRGWLVAAEATPFELSGRFGRRF